MDRAPPVLVVFLLTKKQRDIWMLIKGETMECCVKIKVGFISGSEHYTLGITYNKAILFQVTICIQALFLKVTQK